MKSKWLTIENGVMYTLVLCGGEEEIDGIWLPFGLELNTIEAFKMAAPADSEDEPTAGKTSIFTKNDGNYVVDVPYAAFQEAYAEYRSGEI